MRQSTALRNRRPYITTERLIAIGAVAITAFGFTQPQLLAVAGLDFHRTPVTVAQGIDLAPTGSVGTVGHGSGAPTVHGLAGTLKALRSRD